MTHRPTSLQISAENELVISWNDGVEHRLPVTLLRDVCPCASCREKRSSPQDPMALPVLSQAETQPMRITSMQPVGNYAYGIAFSDGHDTGIFTLDVLRELGNQYAERKASENG